MVASVRNNLNIFGGVFFRVLNACRNQYSRFFIQVAAAERRYLLSDIPVSIRRNESPVCLSRRGRGIRLPVQRVDRQHFGLRLHCCLVHAIIAHDHSRILFALRHFQPRARIQVLLCNAVSDHVRRHKVVRQSFVLSEFNQKVIYIFGALGEPEQNDRSVLLMAVVQIPAERRPDIFFGHFIIELFFFSILQSVDPQRTLPVVRRVDCRVPADDSLFHVECFGKSECVPQACDVFVVRYPHIHIDSRHHRKDIRFGVLRRLLARLRDPEVRTAVVERVRAARHTVRVHFVDLPVIPFVEFFGHSLLDLRPAVVDHEKSFLCFVKRQSPNLTDHPDIVERSLQSNTGIRAVSVHPPAVYVVRFAQIGRTVVCRHVQISLIISDPPHPLGRCL